MRFMMGGMIPPWMMPMMQQEEPQQHQPPDVMIPPRVRQAMEFISMMTAKTQDRPAITENQIEIVKGQKLSDEEQGALAVANNMIARYFAGQLKPDIWEQIRYDAIKKKADMGGTPQRLINCVACNPSLPPSPQCPLCAGSGKLFVQPGGAQSQPRGGLAEIIMGMGGGPAEPNDGDPPDPPFPGAEGFPGVVPPDPPQDK